MRSQVITIHPRAKIWEAAKLMSDCRIGSLVVVEGTKLLGIITERDILSKVVASRKSLDLEVAQVMSPNPITIHPRASLEHAVSLMNQHGIRRLPVVESGKLVGMLTSQDLVRAFSWIKPGPQLELLERELSKIQIQRERERYLP